jgi:hypothetical protein
VLDPAREPPSAEVVRAQIIVQFQSAV